MHFTQLDQLLNAAAPTVAPAVVCRVEQAGKLLFERGYGWINPMLKRQPVEPGTLFDFASLTKLFTTTACLRMWDAGLLNIDRPVSDLVPGFSGVRYVGDVEDPITKLPAPPPEPWQDYQYPIDLAAITLRRLLTHTSGLPAWRNLYRAAGPAPDRPSGMHRAELLRRQMAGLTVILQTEPAYPPGESYLYSDVGLILLGHALTRCTGDVTLAETIQNWVTGPLEMEARFNPSCLLVDRIAPTEFCPWRQRRLHGEVHDENAAGLGGIAGHAGLFGTAADLCTLGNLYLSGGYFLGSGRFMARRIVDESVSVQVEIEEAGLPLQQVPVAAGAPGSAAPIPIGVRRGLGWMLRGDVEPSCSMEFDPRSFGHTGFTGTSLWCDPSRELVVALLTNRVYHGRNPEPITRLRPAVHAAVIAALRR